MAYIKVDHSKFESTAFAIDKYVKILKDNMKKSQSELAYLSVNWQGKDFIQFKNHFEKVDNNDSVHTQMVKSLESYSKFLRYAAEKYKDAQTKAVNRANNLPRW